MTFHQEHWFLADLQYTYLDDGYTLVAVTDVPCHLWKRETTTPPRKHSLPSYRRGLYLTGDIRFCFVVYQDFEQAEAGDTLVHTFTQSGWPVFERRWFYFTGEIASVPSPSESPIFEFVFPAPPPTPPPSLERVFIGSPSNRTIRSMNIAWPACRAGSALIVGNWHLAPLFRLVSYSALTATFLITRSFLFFDTSPLPDTAQIVSAQLSLWGEIKTKTSSAAHPYIQITKGHQSDPPVIGDWFPQTNETQSLGQIHLDNVIIGSYNDLPLNQDGLDHINLTGITKYCIRQQMDIDNFQPPLGTNELAYHSQQKGGGFWPQLKVQYNPA